MFQDGRSSLETSLRPPIDLPSELPYLRTKGGVKGGLWEIYGRSYNNTSRAKTPLYTGIPKEKGRSRHIIMNLLFPAEDGAVAAGGIGTGEVHRIGTAGGGTLADVTMGAHRHEHELAVEIVLPHEDLGLLFICRQADIASDAKAGTENVASIFALENDLSLTFVDNTEAGLGTMV